MIVEFDSPETVAAFEWLAETYDRNGKYAAMLPPGVESWSDTSNNEAFLAGRSATRTTPSASTRRPSATRTRSSRTSCCCTAPKANNGDSRDGGNVGGWLTIFKGAPNVDLAKKLALDLLDPANFTQMSAVAGGLFTPAYENLWTDELLAADPNFAIIKAAGQRRPNPFLGQSWPANPNAGDRRHPRPGRAGAVGGQRHRRPHGAGRCREGRPPEDRRHLRRRRHHAALGSARRGGRRGPPSPSIRCSLLRCPRSVRGRAHSRCSDGPAATLGQLRPT